MLAAFIVRAARILAVEQPGATRDPQGGHRAPLGPGVQCATSPDPHLHPVTHSLSDDSMSTSVD